MSLDIWAIRFSIQEQLLDRNVQRFRGGLVFRAHRLLYHSTLGSCREENESSLQSAEWGGTLYRGTSLIRNTPLLEPYRRTIPRALWWSQVGGLFLMSEVPL